MERKELESLEKKTIYKFKFLQDSQSNIKGKENTLSSFLLTSTKIKFLIHIILMEEHFKQKVGDRFEERCVCASFAF